MSLDLIYLYLEPRGYYPRNPKVLRDYSICPLCRGTGNRKGWFGSLRTCRLCHGAKVFRF